MQKEYLEKIKERNSFIFDEHFKGFLICTDDLDSILSCLMLMHYYPGRFEIGFFYDFREGLYRKWGIDADVTDDNVIGIDLSHPSIKVISNHLTQLDEDDSVNPNDINLNIIDSVNARDYHSKYNLNTFLLVSSLCGHKFDNEVGKALSLCPDSAYLAYYAREDYKDSYIQKKYLNILEYPDVWEVQKNFSRQQFINVQSDMNLKSKLWVTDKGIEFKDNVDLELICEYLGISYDPSVLEGFFYLIEKHESFIGGVNREYNKSDLFSFAITRKNEVKYSMKV